MRYLSVCSGIEAASVAWHPLGWKPLAFAEIEPFPRSVLQNHYPDVPLYGDFTTLRHQDWIVDADLLVGGTPCQAFSVAGLRRSLDDARGNLTLEFVRLANAIDDLRSASSRDPAWIVWENVPGVLSVGDNAFGSFLAALVGHDAAIEPPAGRGWTDSGVVHGPLRCAAWRILDAQYHGVAQRRRRIFVFARGGAGNWDAANALLPIIESMRWNPAPRREARERPAPTVGTCSGTSSGLGQQAINGELVPVAIKGSAIGRQPQNGPQYGDTRQDQMFALNCTEVHAVGVPDISPSIKARDYKGPSSDGAGDGMPLIACDVAPPLTGNPYGDHASREGMLVSCDVADTLTVGANQMTGFIGDVVGTLSCNTGPNGHDAGNFTSNQAVDSGYVIPIGCFDPDKSGDPKSTPQFTPNGCPPLLASHPHAVAYGEPITFKENMSMPSAGINISGTLQTANFHAVTDKMSVRRLLPVECERLQGFPDGYTDVPHKGKPASDGPRYKALGNSMAVPCMAYLGRLINDL